MSLIKKDKLTRELLLKMEKYFSIEQIEDILDKYKYEPRLEMLPNLFVGDWFYVYDYMSGDYIHRTFERKNDNIADDFFEIEDAITIENSSLIIAVQTSRKNRRNSKSILYRLKGNELIHIYSFPNRFIVKYYKDDLLLVHDTVTKLLGLARYRSDRDEVQLLEMEKLYRLSDISWELTQTNYIVIRSVEIYKIDLNKLTIKPLEFILKGYDIFLSIGKDENLIVGKATEEKRPKFYFYDLELNKVDDEELPDIRDMVRINKEYIILSNKLYRIKDNKLTVYKYRYHRIPKVINSSLFVRGSKGDDKHKLIKTDSLLKDDEKIVLEFKADNKIIAVPLDKKDIVKLFEDFSILLSEMISQDIKNIILNFCRSDQIEK